MTLLATYTLEIKKSKFMAYYYEVKEKEEVSRILTQLKADHKKARHIPYAYLLMNTAGKSDDKEPSGTAGSPLYQLLEQRHLTQKALFVVRYFGGTKLGAGGLIRAYVQAGKGAIDLTNPNEDGTL